MKSDHRSSESPKVYGPKEHRVRRINIDSDAARIIERLQRAGHAAYVVGGGVRDLLLGKEPKDFDISTSATPRQIKALFRNSRIIGRRFKLVHIFFSAGKIIETSTFRAQSDPPEVIEEDAEATAPLADDNVYGTEETDAFRRDLTINGLFFDVRGEKVIDYVSGMEDIHNAVVRVIGDPIVRFREDPVRMIRVVRHSARSGFAIEKNCWNALATEKELIAQCATARIFDELKKDLVSGHLLAILSLLSETKLLDLILPELTENNALLLSSKSDLPIALEAIDELIADGEEISPTLPLAILSLFLAAKTPYLATIIEEFEDPHAFEEAFRSAFSHLTVPKKERERILTIVKNWLKLQHIPLLSLKPSSIARNALLEELLHFSVILAQGTEDRERITAIRKALDIHRTHGRDNSQRRMRQERGRHQRGA